MPSMSSPTLIGITEAAEILGLPIRTVKRKVQNGTIPHVAKLAGATGAYVLDLAVITNLASAA